MEFGLRAATAIARPEVITGLARVKYGVNDLNMAECSVGTSDRVGMSSMYKSADLHQVRHFGYNGR